ncbi:hypothetical protein HNR39_004117 [Glaciimonas immobilis]|uniref:Uncharacterized protein n=1 Tax=Glaciimonas immobilis TaxID=728004 RepID=A0A840RXE5_9BURK|nr:hypothetical protein [Glaciimonas immobilis]
MRFGNYFAGLSHYVCNVVCFALDDYARPKHYIMRQSNGCHIEIKVVITLVASEIFVTALWNRPARTNNADRRFVRSGWKSDSRQRIFNSSHHPLGPI